MRAPCRTLIEDVLPFYLSNIYNSQVRNPLLTMNLSAILSSLCYSNGTRAAFPMTYRLLVLHY